MDKQANHLFWAPIKQGIIIAVCTILAISLLYGLYQIHMIVLMSLMGVGFGVILAPMINFMNQRLRIWRSVAAVITFLLIIALFIGTGASLTFLVADEIGPLLQELPGYLQAARDRASTFLRYIPFISDLPSPEQLSSMLPEVLSTILHGLRLGGTALVGLVFIIAVGVYLGMNLSKYFESVLSLFPAYMRSEARRVGKEMAITLRHWLGAQLIIMVIVGLATALALWLIGINHWPLYGVLAGILNFIPYIGPILTAIAISIVVLGSSPESLIMVLIAFTVIQQLESYVLVPLVMRGTVDLPPVYLLILILVMGSWLGLLGMFLASPILALARTLAITLYIPLMDRKTRPGVI